MDSLVSNLTIEEFKDLIETSVEKKIAEFFQDADFGLDLKESIKKRLLEQRQDIQKGDYGRDLNEVLQEMGIS